MEVQFTTAGALIGLVIAIVLIIKKVQPSYSLILGALIGGLIGGGGLVNTVNTMVSGAGSMMSSVLRILTSGILAGALIKTGSAQKIAETIVDKLGERFAVIAIAIATMIICAVGVFIDISVITVAPIALAIGEKGCSAIYGPQKGATPSMILQMDKWLADYAKLAAEYNPRADREFPGTGAAGGMGFAFLSFTNAVLESGIRIVLEETRLEDYVKDADIVVTGEGRLDGQTVMGKAPSGVADIAKKYGKPVVAFAGCVTPDAIACNEHGIDAFFPILRGVVTLQEAMDGANAHKNMADTVEQVFRLLAIQFDR